MPAQRHFQNRVDAGSAVFVTSTVLDFVPVFKDPRVAHVMVECLVQTCAVYGCKLHAYVIMPEHFHAVLRLREDLHVTAFMNALKSISARKIRPLLSSEMEARFSQQTGLNRRTFWQRSFRSFSAEGPKLFNQKVRYIHWNPVKRGLCELPAGYLWSNARLWEEGCWSPEEGLLFQLP